MTGRTIIEYNAEIERRAADLIDGGDLDAIIVAMNHQEWNRWQINLRVIVNAKAERSRQRAADEIRELLRSASFRAAQDAYQADMRLAAQKCALDRFYSHAGVPA